MNKTNCRDCKGKGHFLMMSEFHVPCTTCKGNGWIPNPDEPKEKDA